MDCNVKEQQNAAKGHTVKHTVNPTFIMKFLSVCRVSFGVTNTQPNGQKLGSEPRQRALSNCPCSAAGFGEETHCSKPPTTLSTRSHSMQLLSLLKAKTGLKDHHFTSAEKFNRILQHVTDPYQKKTSRGTSSNGTMLEQAVRAEESRFQGE